MYRIQFAMASPIIMAKPLHLDAVLLAVLVNNGVPFPEALQRLPIPTDHGIYRCSSLLYEGKPSEIRIPAVKSVWRATEQENVALCTEKGFTHAQNGYGKGKKQHPKNELDNYVALDISAPYFFAEASDPDELERLVREIPALGKWARKGYGEIAMVDIEPCDQDPWLTESGEPSRPLPIDLWEQRYGGHHEKAFERVAPPYWGGNRVLCAIKERPL